MHAARITQRYMFTHKNEIMYSRFLFVLPTVSQPAGLSRFVTLRHSKAVLRNPKLQVQVPKLQVQDKITISHAYVLKTSLTREFSATYHQHFTGYRLEIYD